MILEKVVLKPNIVPKIVKIGDNNNIPMQAVKASQVAHIVVRHSNSRIHPQVFSIKPKKYSFKAKVLKPRALQVNGKERETLQMKAIQVPVVINNATTGHKLQGTGIDELFVHSWSYVTNWAYVMLSRVKTCNGLFCRKPLKKDLTKYAMPGCAAPHG